MLPPVFLRYRLNHAISLDAVYPEQVRDDPRSRLGPIQLWNKLRIIFCAQVQRKLRYTLAIVAISAIGIALLLAWSFHAVQQSADRSHRAACLKQIGFALGAFDQAYNRLPEAVHRDDAGQPLCSWRFRIMPHVQAIMRDLDYEARWDDSANEWLTGTPFPLYCFKSNQSPPEALHTCVVLITGPGTAFDDDRTYSLSDIAPDTILAIEIADSDTPWAAPGDLSIDEVTPSILRGLDGSGVHVCFADFEVMFVPAQVRLEDLKKFFTIEGAKKYDRKQILGRLPSGA